MKKLNDKKLNFVLKFYREEIFDPKKAISRFHSSVDERTAGRHAYKWAVTFATAFASIAIVFAAGYGITRAVSHHNRQETVQMPVILNPDVATTHVFVYEDAALEDVINELSEYYGCTITFSPTRRHLTATFPDDDLDLIVSVIESVLNVEITVEK